MRAIFTTAFFLGVSTFVTGCVTSADYPMGTMVIGGYVDPDMAQACINTAANRYYMPTSFIRAVNSQKMANGSTQVIMKVDSRDALCTISAAGNVASFVDTSPKSADQIAAEAQAQVRLAKK